MLYNLFENRAFVSVFAVALLAEGVDRNRSEQASKASRKKATDDTFLNAKGDKALSLLRAMNE